MCQNSVLCIMLHITMCVCVRVCVCVCMCLYIVITGSPRLTVIIIELFHLYFSMWAVILASA